MEYGIELVREENCGAKIVRVNRRIGSSG